MLQAWGFERIAIVLGDIYFLDPDPDPGQEGAERGVRLEIRLVDRPQHGGSIYASQPIFFDRPIWRADLLESVDGGRILDRAHHHPSMDAWEPGARTFDRDLSADPFGWLQARLADLPDLLDRAGLDRTVVHPDDCRQLADSAVEITEAASRLLNRVRNGELARPPDGDDVPAARTGWL